ncbi:hypothetical protein C5S39_03090 [Candidatus Methanophagaceae archaeon]|nr:hypothetical protein C5S39_03090 [Methanophagales archaeon]
MNEDMYPPGKTLELIYNEVKDALNMQFQSIEGLNTKASIIIGFVGVIIGISLQLYSQSNSYLFGSGMTLFMISIFFSFSAYKGKRYRKDPEPRALTVKYLMEDDKTVKKQLIDNFIVSFEDNKTKIEEKVKYINYSIIFLFIGLIVLILSIIVG